MPKPPRADPLTIRLDWKAYFHSFMATHGTPVDWKGVLLFPDGWTYAYEYQGPEWPPPEDESLLREMLLFYWEERLSIVKQELAGKRRLLTSLLEIQRSHSEQVQQKYRIRDEEGSRMESAPVDTFALEERIGYLEADLAECKGKVEGLKRGKESSDCLDGDGIDAAR